MNQTDYTRLDAAIVAKIGRVGANPEPPSFHAIFCDPDVSRECKALAAAHNGDRQSHERGYKEDWRFVGSRLQALKRAGRIRYERRGWVLQAEKAHADQ